jgi:hypothetical protein
MPLTFGALKRQRFRWCFGGIQILRRHWRLMVFGKGTAEDGAPLELTRAQRYGYLAAALQWFQPLLTVTMSALLILGVISASLGHPVAIRPLVGFFIATPAMLLLVGITKSLWGLRARLHVGWVDALGALGIWFALSWAVAVASFKALLRKEGAFLRTPKFAEGQSLRQAVSETRSEIVVAVTLAIGAALAVRSIGGADGWFLASLCLWGALVIGSAPVAAFSAARADLGTVGLQQRRRLEWTRGHSPWRRRSSRFVAVMGVAAGLVLLLGASLGGAQGGSALGALSGHLALPRADISQKSTVHDARAAPGGAASVSSVGSGSALPQQAPSSPLVTRGTSSPASSSAPTPTVQPSRNPSAAPTASSSRRPSATPSAGPTGTPSKTTTSIPSPTGIPSHSHVATGSSLMFETVASGSSGQGSAALVLLIVPFLGAVASRRASRPRAPGTGKLRVMRGRQEE